MPARPRPPEGDEPFLPGGQGAVAKRCLRRGVALFRQLVALAERGEAVGVAYAQFVCLLHGVERYEQAAGRPYARADTPEILRLASRVTAAAGGRPPVSRDGVTIRVGMDSFIWRKERPHPRPRSAFSSTAYTETAWKTIFPDGSRRLLRPGEFRAR